MKKLLILPVSLLFLVLGQSGYAKQISVNLDASDSLIKNYSWSVLLYLKYEDGEEHSGDLFSLDELRSGIKTKPYFIDEAKKITDCIFTWAIMENPPGHSTPTLPLLLPDGFNGMLKSVCKINFTENELKLSFGDYQLKQLRVGVASDAFDARSARAVVYRIQPESSKDKYTFFQKIVRPLDLPHESTKNILFRHKVTFALTNTWVLKNGRTEENPATVTDQLTIEIK